VAIVTAFFGISVLVVGRAAKISPHVMMAAAMISYVVKIIGFAIVMIMLGKSDAFNGRMLGFTALVCILAWTAAEVITTIRLKVLYVDPDRSGSP
jgi:ATP synthase protein I